MTKRQKGFTLVEVLVALVILAILAAVTIPAMTGWIKKAKETRLITACRACVVAAQVLASEEYSEDGPNTPPDSAAVVEMAGVSGVVSGITLDPDSYAVNTLTYSENAESVTYMRLPSPQYIYNTGIAGEVAAASNWAQKYIKSSPSENNEQLTIQFSAQHPSALTAAQLAFIFGDSVPENETQYIYPMAIYDNNGKVLNIQYVTPQNPSATSGQNRYQASAFIIDGKTYLCTLKHGNKVRAVVYATNNNISFQNIMNFKTFESTQDFIDLITTDGGYYQPAG